MDYQDILNEQIARHKTITITLDFSIYSKKTLFRTCYKFTDKAFVYIKLDDNTYKVFLTSKNDTIEATKLIEEFTNELLDQELRELVLEDTKKIRDTIVTRALLSGYSSAV
ncbi:MAG: His-Xaa-Ser system protein HxsD [Campylobacterales bacterium]|nr:His-Xaa-Ser system protein HxsD [Campylobacterales bacterium]